ncbi:NAD-P-binding protein [Trametes maxima]|nr:NAD-P-binding protein [Trametes maxima]
MVTPRVWLSESDPLALCGQPSLISRIAVTGASAGFGRSLTEVVLAKGEIVVATARRTHLLDDLVQRYSSDRILIVKMEVTNRPDVADAFSQAKSSFGRIDVVFNNAGYADLGEFESMDDAQGRALIETNFWGAVSVTREAIKHFRESNPPGVGGRLLQMSSIYGIMGTHGESFYAASKHALEGLTKCIVQELDPRWNIKVTLLEPGYFRSDLYGRVKWSAPHPAYKDPDSPVSRLRAGWESYVPAGNPEKAAEIFYRVAGISDPPLQLLVGEDAVATTKEMLAELVKTVETYESWSEYTESDA